MINSDSDDLRRNRVRLQPGKIFYEVITGFIDNWASFFEAYKSLIRIKI